jgi:OmpA-OmpF porin, OOP family
MKKSKLLIALIGLSASGVAFAGGTVRQAPAEAAAEVAPAPAPAPEAVVPAPAPTPVVVAPAFVPSWYVGASVGRSNYSDADNGTGWKVFGGYRFHPNFAAELSYVDLGNSTDAGGLTAKSRGGSLDALGILPFGNNFDVFAKVGVADMKVSGDVSSGSKASANYGIGATYHFSHTIGVRAEAERFQKVGDRFGSANLYSIGIQYGF